MIVRFLAILLSGLMLAGLLFVSAVAAVAVLAVVVPLGLGLSFYWRWRMKRRPPAPANDPRIIDAEYEVVEEEPKRSARS